MIDPDLIKRCQEAEEDAFDTLYKLIGKKAFWTAYLLSGCRSTAEDIVQETFFECFRDIGKLQKAELFQAWFNRILVRKCQLFTSKRKKNTAESLDSMTEQLVSGYNVAETAELNYTGAILRQAVNRLSAPMRTTVVLFYYNNLSIKEIAKTMGCFQGTVKSRLYYAKKVLEKELAQELSEDRFIKSIDFGKGQTAHE